MEMKDSLNIREKTKKHIHAYAHISLAQNLEKNLTILQDLNYDNNCFLYSLFLLQIVWIATPVRMKCCFKSHTAKRCQIKNMPN